MSRHCVHKVVHFVYDYGVVINPFCHGAHSQVKIAEVLHVVFCYKIVCWLVVIKLRFAICEDQDPGVVEDNDRHV